MCSNWVQNQPKPANSLARKFNVLWALVPCVGLQIVDEAELLIQPLIVLRGKRLGQITGRGRKIRSLNEAGLEGMAVVDQVLKQTAEHE
jgi:hypothetical protein